MSKEGCVCVYDYQQGICFDNYKAWTQNFRFTNKASHFWVFFICCHIPTTTTNFFYWTYNVTFYINLLLNCNKTTFKKWSIIEGCQLFWLSPRHFSTGHRVMIHADNKILFVWSWKYFSLGKYSWEAVSGLINGTVYASRPGLPAPDKWDLEDNWALFSYNINITANNR